MKQSIRACGSMVIMVGPRLCHLNSAIVIVLEWNPLMVHAKFTMVLLQGIFWDENMPRFNHLIFCFPIGGMK
jgi:hypothetical protein